MPKLMDLSGMRYGKLVVLSRFEENTKSGKPQWVCLCDCGKKTVVPAQALKSGNTKSCGCLKIETGRINGKKVKHGESHTRLYNIWHSMKRRCYAVSSKDFVNYGGRGITVCSEWLNDFQAFHDWAVSHGYSDELTIDRIDNDKGYSPDNCRWVTTKEQNQKKRNVKLIEWNGQTHTLTEWATITGISAGVLSRRLKTGWSIEDTLTIKPIVGATNH